LKGVIERIFLEFCLRKDGKLPLYQEIIMCAVGNGGLDDYSHSYSIVFYRAKRANALCIMCPTSGDFYWYPKKPALALEDSNTTLEEMFSEFHVMGFYGLRRKMVWPHKLDKERAKEEVHQFNKFYNQMFEVMSGT
jgi:hypothetical protein